MIVSKYIMYKYSVGQQIIIYECTGWAKKPDHFKKCITPVYMLT